MNTNIYFDQLDKIKREFANTSNYREIKELYNVRNEVLFKAGYDLKRTKLEKLFYKSLAVKEKGRKIRYMIDYYNSFKYSQRFKERNDFFDADDIIGYIIKSTLQKLAKKYPEMLDCKKNISPTFDFENLCTYVSKIVYLKANELGLKNYRIKIDPAYSQKANLYNGDGFHYFNIIEVNNNYYLVDLSYLQFFKLRYNLASLIGIYDYYLCDVGYYMVKDAQRKTVAQTILNTGYIKLDKQNFKDYLDGFTLSFRNALFYENLGYVSYTTPYNYNDYINFLTGKDNQLKHEDWDFLGPQRKLLRNTNLKF